MRDVVFTLIMTPLLPVCFARPWIGILVWSWLGYMNPHQHCYGFAKWTIPWAQLVAVATIGGFLLTKDRKPFIVSRESLALIALPVWFTVTTFFAWDKSDAWWQWARVSKIIVMSLLTIPLMQDRARLRWLLLVIAGSIGFYGLKAGIFVIATGGNYMVFGAPGNTFVSQNNMIALALNMCLPIMWYLRKEEPRRWARHLLLATFCMSVLAVPFTYSRGGVLGLGVTLTALFFRARFRFVALPVLALGALVLFSYAPEKWVSRMETIQTYGRDQSAMSRLMAWRVGIAIANDSPLTGGGFWVFNQPETYQRYAPGHPSFIDAHSIYFNLLGEHGYVGLGIFVFLALSSLASLFRIYTIGRYYKELAWASDYAHMLAVSILAYLATGAFLSASYFDLAYHFFVLTIVLKHLAWQELAARSARANLLLPVARGPATRSRPVMTPASAPATGGPDSRPATALRPQRV